MLMELLKLSAFLIVTPDFVVSPVTFETADLLCTPKIFDIPVTFNEIGFNPGPIMQFAIGIAGPPAPIQTGPFSTVVPGIAGTAGKNE
jgi:hypothetical protein